MDELQLSIEDLSTEEVIETNPYQNKDRKLVTQPYDMSVATVVAQIKNHDIILDPEYQRKYRWSPVKASRFIESLLLNVPIPTVFLAEEEDITYTVIDGQQRLSTIRNFIEGEGTEDELTLQGLQIRADLNDKKYSDLSREDKGKLNKQYIRCIVILNDSDPQIKFDVFERLNSGSTHLTEQEIRNCIYRGNFNTLLKQLSENQNFNSMLKLPEKDQKNMTNVEYVLRFLSYRESLNQYQGSVKEFLNDFMKDNRVISDERSLFFTELFNSTIEVIHHIFGNNGFSRFLPSRDSWHNALNRAVFDAEMVAFSRFHFNISELDNEGIMRNIKELMSDAAFVRTIASSTNSPEKVKLRIRLMEECISEFGVKRSC
ncbi:DUF262 domain-containing protein [Paenibacillus sabinae]|uniref:GmrSD restriction endonucleases N-terminal domain-containing protein n=1 Tax=Paenibacillus sabinae T27 TaxID=1268072 RepID=X4ZJR3_9BACL|nr:DUF262 domain-containing protein [Paenibacillus sabinae]AHV99666.1 hypothetical protein PSAB_23895 [Paenibacillus sabinae T27]